MPVFRAGKEARKAVLDLLFAAQSRIEPMLDALPDLDPPTE
jgi:hypothetical protein